MGFGQYPEMGPKVGKSGVLGAEVGENGSKPTFLPTLNPFRDIDQNHFLTHFKGVEFVSKKGPEAALTQQKSFGGRFRWRSGI